MAAQQQNRKKLAEEQEEIEEMQHGPFPIEQLQDVQNACLSILGSLRYKTLKDYEVRFNEALKSEEGFAAMPKDCSDFLMSTFEKSFKGVGQEVLNTFNAIEDIWHVVNVHAVHITSNHKAKISMLTSLFEEKLNNALSEPVKSLLDDACDKTWQTIRRLVQQEQMTTLVDFAGTLSSFDFDQVIINKLVARLEKHAIRIVESMAKEKAARVLINMKDRFNKVFSYDSNSMKRLWTEKEDIKAITKMAHSASLKLLSVIAAIRLDEENDNIEETLQLALIDVPDSNQWSLDPLAILASHTWENVSKTRTLIAPIQCKSLLRQFRKQTKYTVERAIVAQKIYKRKNNKWPPLWAIMAILILGFNEFYTILSNPSYLWVIFVAFLLSMTLFFQLDISDKFEMELFLGSFGYP